MKNKLDYIHGVALQLSAKQSARIVGEICVFLPRWDK